MKDIYITQSDMDRLRGLLAIRPENPEQRACLERLEEELDRAHVMSADGRAANVVTMHSQVRLQDLDTGQMKEYTLVFPGERVPGAECISVLAPIGTALLGYSPGSVIHWPVPKGIRRLKVLRIVQPKVAVGA